MKIEPLNWDSEFFKFKIGACYFTKPDLVPLQELDDYHLVYLFDESNQMKFDEWIFQNHSIQFSSTKCTYHWKVEPKEFKPNTVQTNLEISNYSDEPLEKLKELVLISGAFSRFKLDPNFLRTQFEQLYEAWLNNSIDGQLADMVVVAQHQHKIAGFVTLKVNTSKESGSIGLISVDPKFQNLGIGQSLMQYVKQIALKKNLKLISVVTQLENNGACSFYERNGLHLFNSINVHHLWKN